MSSNSTKIDLKQNDYTGHAESYDANRFNGRENQYLEMLRRRAVLKAFAGCPNREVLLDVGCGTGRGMGYLTAERWQHMVGLDFTPAMLTRASSKLQSSGNGRAVSFLQGDAFKLPFLDRSISAVMSLNFLHMFRIELQEQLISEMVRVCRPKGLLVVELDSVHKGLFFSRYFEQRRVAGRTKFNSMWEIRRLFPAERFSNVCVCTALPCHWATVPSATLLELDTPWRRLHTGRRSSGCASGSSFAVQSGKADGLSAAMVKRRQPVSEYLNL